MIALLASTALAAVTTSGEVRLLGTLPADAPVDNEGTTIGQGPVLDSRLRLGLATELVGWRARAEADLFDGQLAGDPWDISGAEDARDRGVVDVGSRDAFSLRRLSMDGLAGPLAVEAGLVTSHWGLGMLANDGAHDPYFGRSDFGDRVVRVRVASRPMGADSPLLFAVAGDRVVEDESADWDLAGDGQAAWQAIGTVLWAQKDGPKGGVYGVYRHQVEADAERETDVVVLDLYGDLPITVGSATVRVAAEAAAIQGRTDRAQSYNSRDGLDVRSSGATGLVEVQTAGLPGRALLRAGWASGDGDPDDGTSADFTFDRDFDVGMVLFDELLGAVDAAAYAQVSDPEHAGQAPDGAELLVAEGAFRRATFVQPLLVVTPKPWMDVSAGVLAAWATAPISQPFTTTRNGGVPTNHLGEATSGYALGTEFDWAVELGDQAVTLGEIATRPTLIVQGGHLFASPNLGGGTLTHVTATARLRW